MLSKTIFLLILASNLLSNSKGNIGGEVIDSETQQPIIGANIVLVNSNMGTATDFNGEFSIYNVPTGSYSIFISMIGYESITRTNVNINSNRTTPLKINLYQTSLIGDEIVSKAGYFEKAEDAIVSTQTIDGEEIRSDPVGAYDIQMMIHSLPSVITATDQSNEIVVRGGGPAENLFIVDNLEIPNPNHFGEVGSGGGPVNIINTEFVERIDFFSGGFPARYGDKQSSVMDINLREGSLENFELDLEMSMAGIGFLAEGPILNGKGSFISSYRKSFIEHLIKSAGLTSVPKYSNTQHKISYDIDNKNKLIFNFIGAVDSIEIKDENRPDLRGAENVSYSGFQYTGGVTYKSLFSDKAYFMLTAGKTLSSWNAEVYKKEETIVDTFFYRDNVESDIFFKWDMVYKINRKLKFSTGLNVKHGEYEMNEDLDPDTVYVYDYPNLEDGILNNYNDYYDFESNYSEELHHIHNFEQIGIAYINPSFTNNKEGGLWKYALYGQLKFNLNPFVITTGLRYDLVPYNDHSSISPRLALSYLLSPITKVNLALGKYYQTPSYWVFLNPDNTKPLKHSYSDQIILGIEHYINSDVKMTIEWYKKYIYNRAILVSDITPNPLDAALGFVDIGEGESQGLELFIQKKYSEKWYGRFSYSYSESLAEDYREGKSNQYSWDFDIRNSLTLVGGYKINFNDYSWYNTYRYSNLFKFSSWLPFMPADQFELSFRCRYSDGLPYTPKEYDFYTRKWSINPDAELNSLRDDYYFRIDFMILRRFNFKNINLTTFIDIQNILDRDNEWEKIYFDDGTYKMSYQYKQIPVAGVIIEF